MNLVQPLRALRSYVLARGCASLSLRRTGLVAYATFAITASAADTQQTLSVADYRTYLEASHPVPQALQHLSDSFNTSNSGNWQLQVIRNPVGGTPLQQIQAVQQGAAGAPQIMLAAATGLAELASSFALFDQPYAIANAEQAEQFYASAQADAMLQQLQQHGLHGLAWMENGFRIVTAERPLTQMEDLQGLRIRTVPNALSTQLFAALGATPVSMPAHQVPNALKNGEIQAQESFITLALQQGASALQPHLWLTQHSYGAQVLVMNLQAWQALSAQEQQRLEAAARQAAIQQRQNARQADQQALQRMTEMGMQLHQPSAQLQRTFEDATRHLRTIPLAAPQPPPPL